METGLDASQTLGNALFHELHNRLPDLRNIFDYVETVDIVNGQPIFRMEELDMLHKHIKSTNRIKLLHESRPDDQGPAASAFFDDYQTALKESAFSVARGNFQQGLLTFKKATIDMAVQCNDREDRFAVRIAVAAEKEDTTGIVGHIGGAHSRLGHILSKDQYCVTRTFTGNENGQFIYDPASEAERRLQFFPNKEIPEHEWYRLMIGSAINGFLLSHYRGNQIPADQRASEQQVARLSRSYLESLALTDMRSIRNFERGVKQNGFTKEINRRIEEQQTT